MGATLDLLASHPLDGSSPTGRGDLARVMARHPRPISYGHLDRAYPLTDYQTIFGTRPGSAEMASAARPFSTDLVTRLVSRGIGVMPVTLHTGVSSQEAGEAPQTERPEVTEAAGRDEAVAGGYLWHEFGMRGCSCPRFVVQGSGFTGQPVNPGVGRQRFSVQARVSPASR